MLLSTSGAALQCIGEQMHSLTACIPEWGLQLNWGPAGEGMSWAVLIANIPWQDACVVWNTTAGESMTLCERVVSLRLVNFQLGLGLLSQSRQIQSRQIQPSWCSTCANSSAA